MGKISRNREYLTRMQTPRVAQKGRLVCGGPTCPQTHAPLIVRRGNERTQEAGDLGCAQGMQADGQAEAHQQGGGEAGLDGLARRVVACHRLDALSYWSCFWRGAARSIPTSCLSDASDNQFLRQELREDGGEAASGGAIS